MTRYACPSRAPDPRRSRDTVYTVASGDLRLSANVTVLADPAAAGGRRRRGDRRARLVGAAAATRSIPSKGHGFIDSQRRGHRGVQGASRRTPPLVVVEAVWQYSHHVLAGLRTHRGPILVVANWTGEFPGLVGLLGLTGEPDQGRRRLLGAVEPGLHRRVGRDGLRTWLETGKIEHDRQPRARPARP